MLMPLEICLIIGVSFMVAWRVSTLAKQTMIICWLVLAGAGVLLSFTGTVGVTPINGENYTAADIIFPMVAGIVLGLAVRWADGKFPRIERKAPVAASATPTSSNGGAHVFNASASAVVGMNTEPPPARGGLL